ncbi:MAG TPA: leucyl aminopeptidase family protein [Sphingomicrobium sp.]|nr:leucyl aminopeptidase family protein [Sphingomicrobium sp.]
MNHFADFLKPDRGESAHSIHLVDKDSAADWIKSQSAPRRSLIEAARFDGQSSFQFVILPGQTGDGFDVVSAVKNVASLSPWCLARLAEALPEGNYRLSDGDAGASALGWVLAQHRFDRFKSKPKPFVGPRTLLTASAAAIDSTIRVAEATALVRDLVDTPAADLGPAELEEAARAVADEFCATIEVVKGDALDQGYPMIAAVGNGATRERKPRLIELRWGKPSDPLVAIIGKGVCFDSGGLDIKSAGGMRLMKKDMGGAAHALALARLIIGARLPIRVHLLIPAVENAVSAAAFRPGDVLDSRLGLKVEIDNTDAEGRLVLGDAIARAGESEPVMIIDFATLTGAARVALGPDLPAMFANDDPLAADLLDAAREVDDPVWRMPLWAPYHDMLKSDLADLSNSADSPMAGAVTAALFLNRFIPDGTPWIHFDTFAWRPTAKPGRPKGGDALGLRAAFAMLQARFGG